MPLTVNGIGTQYYGRKNQIVRRQMCKECGRTCDHSSYDTTLYFVVLFLPVIPLGKKRILLDCSSCRRHRVLPLKKWESQRDDRIGAALAAMKADPDNPALAVNAVMATVTFDARDDFVTLTRLFTPALSRDAHFLATIGDAYGQFGMTEEQAAAYRAAWAIEQRPAITRALAVTLFYKGETDEPLALARPLLETGQDEGLLYLAVEALQARGRHTEALALLELFGARNPAVAQSKPFLKYQRTSSKRSESGKPVRSAALSSPKSVRVGDSLLGKRLAVGAALAVVSLALVGCLIVSYMKGAMREVWVFNGLSEPALMTIGPKTLRVPGMSAAKVRLGEGTFHVAVTAPKGRVPETDVTIETNYFTRLFTDPTFVINPDQLGVLEVETATFNLGGTVPSKWELLRGKTLHTVSVDYPFQPLPHNLQVQRGTGKTVKTRMDIARGVSTADLLTDVLTREGAEALSTLVRTGLERDPTNEAYCGAARLLEPKGVLDLVSPMLEQRPVLVDIHRLYQDLQRQTKPGDEVLLNQYRAWQSADPKNASLAYLTGRISNDRAEHDRLILQAVTASPPEARAVRSWADSLLSRGEFERAVATARTGRAAGAGDELLAETERYALLAQGKVTEALEQPEMVVPVQQLSPKVYATKVRLLILAGREHDAQSLIQDLAAYETTNKGVVTSFYLWLVSYARGDMAAAVRDMELIGSELFAARTLLMKGDFKGAVNKAEASGLDQPDFLLEVCLAAIARGDDTTLKQISRRVAKALEKGDYWTREQAGMLSGTRACTRETLEDLYLKPEKRAQFMVIVAALRPEGRAEALRQAELFNFAGEYPAHLVKQGIARLQKLGN